MSIHLAPSRHRAGGAPITIASGQDDPFDLTVDADGVYWTSVGANTVQAIPLQGGSPVLLAEAGNPLGIVVRSGRVYFTDTSSGTTTATASTSGGQGGGAFCGGKAGIQCPPGAFPPRRSAKRWRRRAGAARSISPSTALLRA